MTGAYLSDKLRLLLLHLCPLWLRRSARGNGWRGGCRGRLRYGKEDEWRGGDGMVVRIWFFRKIKRKGEGEEDRGGGWRARGVGLLVRFGGRCGG